MDDATYNAIEAADAIIAYYAKCFDNVLRIASKGMPAIADEDIAYRRAALSYSDAVLTAVRCKARDSAWMSLETAEDVDNVRDAWAA